MSREQAGALRVAVATSDGNFIDLHLGRSDGFRIYEVGAGAAHRLLEERRAPARIDPHSLDGLPALLGDVDVVLARRAGPGAIRALGAVGVQVFAVEGAVETALAAIARRGFLLQATPGGRPAAEGPAPGCGPECGPCSCEGDCTPDPGGCGGCR